MISLPVPQSYFLEATGKASRDVRVNLAHRLGSWAAHEEHQNILSNVVLAVSDYKRAAWESFGKDLGGIVTDLVGDPTSN